MFVLTGLRGAYSFIASTGAFRAASASKEQKMSELRIIAKAMKDGKPEQDLVILPALANRHGLITGATGTGKTVTLQKMAEQFSRIGVPVFLSDVKGDLSGIGAEGVPSETAGARRRSASPTGSRRPAPLSRGIFTAKRATRSAPRFPISGRCCWGACWI